MLYALYYGKNFILSFHHNPRVEVIPILRIKLRQLRFRDVSNLSEVTQLPNTEAISYSKLH